MDAKTRVSADAKLINFVNLRQGYGVARVYGADLDFSRRPFGKIYVEHKINGTHTTSELTLREAQISNCQVIR